MTPGVYFGFHESVYHEDPALGSTDKKTLLGDPLAYWWRSPLNPMREPDEDTPAKLKGRAAHCYVLFGPEAFDAAYGRCEFPGNIKAGKDERADFASEGKTALAAKDFDRIVAAATTIRANPEIQSAFIGGYPEVSVFWRTIVDGEEVEEKARFDYLKPRAIPDLKSHDPMEGVSFSTSCLRAIKTYRYDIQAASYLQAREKITQFVADGAVYGDHDPAWLREVASREDFAFVLCFWSSTGAPNTWGGVFSPANPKIVQARNDIALALRTFVDCRREFGPDVAWVTHEPLAEIQPDEIDNWFYRDRAA
ncbi:PD-(D/E)XK nuclease-like domain-containing protein [Acuticoccus sediminis]|nr:PD-(D/E)XK nuclease-like domain-containing protein [Acuticoccus sediminis]